MKKKLALIFSILFLVVTSGYLYIRYSLLKTKEFRPDNFKAKNVLDLRPSIIAKLQQLVKEGSDGLYLLSIEKLDVDVLDSKLNFNNASITIDTAAMEQLEKLKKLPDDIFKIKFTSLHIEGIGIQDLLNKGKIDISGILLNDPVIEVFHKSRPYNKTKRKTNETLSLYKKLKGQAQSIKIGRINIVRGTFINDNVAKKNCITRFNDISITIQDLLIDSTTQYDNNRFLFAKHTVIECKKYLYSTRDSLYFFKVGSITIAGEQRKIVASDVEFKPRLSKQQFESKLSTRKNMYHLTFPRVVLSNVNWWEMMNHEKFIAKEVEITNGIFYDYLDKSLPPKPYIKIDNFPQQMLMKIPVPLSLSKLTLRHLDVAYEELNPAIKKSAIISFNNINGILTHISNIPAEIKQSNHINFSGKGLFMHKVAMTAKLTLDLSKYRTGEFIADVHMDTLNKTIVNTIAEPLELFSIRKGEMQQATAHVEGNNFTTKGTIAFYYTNLNVTLLKKDSGEDGKLKKKKVTSFLANTFLIKDSNPLTGEDPRKPEFSVDRAKYGTFFKFVLVSVLTGILKTIGIPVKLVLK